MTDDERALLASSYLDGEASADERARVDDDAAALAEVDRLRAARALVADVPPPRVSVREQHLAAALDAWERVPGEADHTPTSGADRRRRRRSASTTNRWLLAAAAGLVVVLAGGLTLRSLTDRDDADEQIATEAADAPADAAARDAVADDASTESAADDEALTLSEAVEEAEMADAPAPTPEPGTADTDTDPAAADAAAAPPADDDLVVLTTPRELASFASDLLAADAELADANAQVIGGDGESSGTLPGGARTIPPADEESLGIAELPECPNADRYVGPAIYGEVEVIVVIDLGRDRALAYTIDCQLRAQAPLSAAD